MKSSPRDPDWLETLAIEAFNEHTLAGLALGVVRDGALERFVGLGLADAEARRPVDAGTVFRIGSISKTMTAIAVMQLVEEGALGLDDPVDERLRSARVTTPRGAPPVTVRHLLTHTAGIGEIRGWDDLLRPMIGLAAKPGERPPDLADYYRPGLRTEVAPGTKWAYANHGFALLGLLVQDLRGRPFADVMRERIFDPLGMEHTDFLRTERVRDRLAVGYGMRIKRMKAVKDREIAVAPAGSCFSCTEDMARYMAMLQRGGEPLLRRETLELMLAPHGEPNDLLPAMGLSFFLERIAGHRTAGHDGGWPGFISSMIVAPDDGVGVVAFTNTNTLPVPRLLGERVLRKLVDAPEPADPVVAQAPELWPELAGVYRPLPGLKTNFRLWPVLGGEAEVTVRKGHLVVRAASPLKPLRKGVRLRPADPEDPLVFEATHEDVRVPLAFERGPDGGIAALRVATALGGFARLRRRPRATSLRLWSRAAGTATAGAAATAVVRRVRRRRRGSAVTDALRRR